MASTVAFPFRLIGGQVAYVDDASDHAVAQTIAMYGGTGRDERPLFDGAGVPEPVHDAVDVRALNAALALWGPEDVVVESITVEHSGSYEVATVEFTRQ